MPNTIAYLMLLVWPVVTIVLFKRTEPGRALIWTFLGAHLLLPPVAEFNFPMIPAFDKVSIPSLMAFLLCVFMLQRRVSLLPASAIGRVLLIMFMISPFATVLANTDPIPTAGGWSLPALRTYDAIAVAAHQFIMVLPFLLARQFLATEAAQRDILWALMIAALFYSVPMLWEVRMSPQLNVWIYGFFPHDFGQQIRFGGFRPVVFLGHGLAVAFFTMMALVASVGLARNAPPEIRGRYILAVLYLGVVLILCKSAGSLVYSLFLIPLVLLLDTRAQIRIAAGLALIALCYPLLRGAGMIPVEAILAQAETFGAERAQSLEFRFAHEEMLLERANERPLLGWGGWGRSAIYDAITGRTLSVTDGRWIIVAGTHGWLGYLAEFGLLALPLILISLLTFKGRARLLSPHAGILALLLGVNMIDLIPNAPLWTLTWMIAGALLGYGEALKASAKTVERGRGYRGQRPRIHSPAS